MSGLISGLRGRLASIAGPGLIAWNDATAYAAGTLGAKIKAILAGPNFTGPVTLPANAAAALQATPLQQVNSLIATAVADVLDGATLTGPLVLPGNAASGLQATPLQQVTALLAALRSAAPGDFALSASGDASALPRVLVQGQAVDITGAMASLLALWCGAVLNNHADPSLKADFYYRCTDPLSPDTTRNNAGNYLKLPPPGYFIRILNTGGAGVDAGRGAFKLQADDNKAHTHGDGDLGPVADGAGLVGGVAVLTQSTTAPQSSGGIEARPKNWGVYVWLWY